jgi:hypothetical protein
MELFHADALLLEWQSRLLNSSSSVEAKAQEQEGGLVESCLSLTAPDEKVLSERQVLVKSLHPNTFSLHMTHQP